MCECMYTWTSSRPTWRQEKFWSCYHLDRLVYAALRALSEPAVNQCGIIMIPLGVGTWITDHTGTDTWDVNTCTGTVTCAMSTWCTTGTNNWFLCRVIWFFVFDVIVHLCLITSIPPVGQINYQKREYSSDNYECWMISVVVEQEILEVQDVLDTEDSAELHLLQQLQQADETIAQLLEQREPTSQSKS